MIWHKTIKNEVIKKVINDFLFVVIQRLKNQECLCLSLIHTLHLLQWIMFYFRITLQIVQDNILDGRNERLIIGRLEEHIPDSVWSLRGKILYRIKHRMVSILIVRLI